VAFGIFVERNADGSVTFSGVQEGDSYSISTGSNFDAVVVQQVSGGFDLGIFSLGGGASGTPIVQNFGIVAIDADGDAQTSTITTTINPAGAVPAAAMAIALDKSVDSAPTSSLTSLSQDTQELRNYSAANSNLVLASALAAVGLATTPVAAHVDDHTGDTMQSAAMPMGGMAEAATVSFDRAPAETAHGLDAQVVTADAAMTGRLGDFTSSHDAQLAPEAHLDLQDLSALVAPSDLPVDIGATAAAGMGADIVIPSTEALESMAAASDIANAQRGLTVDRVIAEALDGGAGGDMVDAALAALTEHGGGGNSALLALASHDGTGVSAWDMGPAGHLSADLITNIVMDVSTFHHDAVQPAING
jgi:hypothetical protein